MKHPKLDTERGREQQRVNIERSKERIRHSSFNRKWMSVEHEWQADNFRFICWGDITELPLWKRP